MKFLQTLSESHLLSSKSAYKRYSARQIAELVYLHIISLRILASEPLTQHWAHDYAMRSARYLGFAKWYQNATDLHLLLHALVDEEVELKMPESSMRFKETLYFDESEIKRWLKDISTGHINEPRTRSLFLHLDGQFQIKDSSMKSIRRIVQDWPHDTHRQKQLAMTRILQIMRNRCRMSDLLVKLNELAHQLDLELEGVANQETGDEAADDGRDPHFVEQPKKPSALKRIGSAALGGILGYHTVKSVMEGADRFVVSSYHDEVTRHGPYFKVVDSTTGETVTQSIKGVTYPADGFQTRRSAATFAQKLNDECAIDEAEKQLEEEAAAAATASGDIAQVSQPMMATQRRIPRKKRKSDK